MSSMQINNSEFIEVLYNTCYGGWSPSPLATELYKIRMKEKYPNFISDESFSFYFPQSYRHDPILVQIFKELGAEFDDEYSRTQLVSIPKIYIERYSITEDPEADGIEKVVIDVTPKYNLDY